MEGARRTAFMIDEAFDAIAPGEFYPLQCTAKDPEFLNLTGAPPRNSERVKRAGEKLYGSLIAHKDVEKFFALTSAVPAATGQPKVFPLYIRIETPEAEDLPWETLWEKYKTFMVLDPQGRWPIARLASMSKPPEPLHKNIGEGLRLVVVIAAASENGLNEWQSISQAFESLKVPLEVLALVSEDATKTAIANAAIALQAAVPTRKIQVEYVGDNATTFVDRLRSYMPNMVHIFCHGLAVDRPELELETRSDRLAKNPQGTIRLRSADLEPLASLDSLWLLVLNCCQGVKTAPQLHSIARDMVAQGVPAVVAMRESIHVDDAHLFADHFYPDLFTQLNAIFGARNRNPRPPTVLFPEILWVRAAHKARRELSSARNRIPEAWAEWTYPVVYINRDKLHLHPRAGVILTVDQRLELMATLDVLRSIREPLRFSTDPEAAQEQARLNIEINQIEAQLAGG
jgi:hypothetical protein